MTERKFYRHFHESGDTQELTEEQWRSYAEGNVIDVDLAVEAGFSTLGAAYFTRD